MTVNQQQALYDMTLGAARATPDRSFNARPGAPARETIVRSQTDNKCLLIVLVSGSSRVPSPPAGATPFIGSVYSLIHQGQAKQTGRGLTAT